MKTLNRTLMTALMLGLFAIAFTSGCGKKDGAVPGSSEASAEMPKKKVGWSFYYAWSLEAAANDFGDFDEKEGAVAGLEKKYGVDITMQRLEYMESLNAFQVGTIDAVAVTNTDALATAYGRKKQIGDASVVVFATSHSDGADIIFGDENIKTWADLKGIPVMGAEFSVTHYLFWRCCQLNDAVYANYVFKNLDPVEGAPQFATSQNDIRAWGGWSPETFVVMDGRKGANNICDSSRLDKYEITDLWLVGQKALDEPGGKEMVHVLADALDNMASRMTDPVHRDAALKATSRRFNGLEHDKIDRAAVLTKVLPPSSKAHVITSAEMHQNMRRVADFTIDHNLTEGRTVKYDWGTKAEAPDAVLRFDLSYLK